MLCPAAATPAPGRVSASGGKTEWPAVEQRNRGDRSARHTFQDFCGVAKALAHHLVVVK
jgi:hypothetical protein